MKISQIQYTIRDMLVDVSDYRITTAVQKPDSTRLYFGALERIVDSTEENDDFAEEYQKYKMHFDLARMERIERFSNTSTWYSRFAIVAMAGSLLTDPLALHENPFIAYIPSLLFGVGFGLMGMSIAGRIVLGADKRALDMTKEAQDITWQYAVRNSEEVLRSKVQEYNSLAA